MKERVKTDKKEKYGKIYIEARVQIVLTLI